MLHGTLQERLLDNIQLSPTVTITKIQVKIQTTLSMLYVVRA